MVPYIVATLFLAGLSVAQTQHNLNLTEVANLTSVDGQVSSNAQLSKRDDPPNNGTEWKDVADEGIGGILDIVKDLIDNIFDKDKDSTITKSVTLTHTVTGDLGVPTSSPDPEPTSAPEKTTRTITSTQDPGTITTTITLTSRPGQTSLPQVPPTTLVKSARGTTETVMLPHQSGCSKVDDNGRLTVGVC